MTHPPPQEKIQYYEDLLKEGPILTEKVNLLERELSFKVLGMGKLTYCKLLAVL